MILSDLTSVLRLQDLELHVMVPVYGSHSALVHEGMTLRYVIPSPGQMRPSREEQPAQSAVPGAVPADWGTVAGTCNPLGTPAGAETLRMLMAQGSSWAGLSQVWQAQLCFPQNHRIIKDGKTSKTTGSNH